VTRCGWQQCRTSCCEEVVGPNAIYVVGMSSCKLCFQVIMSRLCNHHAWDTCSNIHPANGSVQSGTLRSPRMLDPPPHAPEGDQVPCLGCHALRMLKSASLHPGLLNKPMEFARTLSIPRLSPDRVRL
jgi:hypothetical protein